MFHTGPGCLQPLNHVVGLSSQFPENNSSSASVMRVLRYVASADRHRAGFAACRTAISPHSCAKLLGQHTPHRLLQLYARACCLPWACCQLGVLLG